MRRCLDPGEAQAVLDTCAPVEGMLGECGAVAIAINTELFSGQRRYRAAVNDYAYRHGRWVGHVAVLCYGMYWDLNGAHGRRWLAEYGALKIPWTHRLLRLLGQSHMTIEGHRVDRIPTPSATQARKYRIIDVTEDDIHENMPGTAPYRPRYALRWAREQAEQAWQRS